MITIGVTSNSQPTITVGLESTGVFLGIVVSLTVLLGSLVKIVSTFNKVASDIRDLKDYIKNHASSEGHERLLQQVRILQSEFNAHDKMLGIHLQNFENRKEAVQFLFGQLNEKIDNKSVRIEMEVKEIRKELKEVQGFLHKHEDFVIRNRED
ncbi:MAG: hypothetical protein RM368_28025 [Nostoc sp. DedSLP03]|uniref:hypothetical protein n=1 Tax=Nostoc sp. DedSLP03 TaxID=3075400 RepID=UPI002AD45ABC|nr:hypothetical protein [Nostoc sp. DedSLP03]MDZ7968756.1 hypothetical protein [Nostoc sp. DedSLP03]